MPHLKVLEEADLVIPSASVVSVNHLNVAPIQEIHEFWIGPHAASATVWLTKLKGDLERGP